jgi:hypothetical protein
MPSQYYGIDRGAQATTVSTGAATTGKKIELVVDLSANASRADVLLSLDRLKQFILSERSTPFAQ